MANSEIIVKLDPEQMEYIRTEFLNVAEKQRSRIAELEAALREIRKIVMVYGFEHEIIDNMKRIAEKALGTP